MRMDIERTKMVFRVWKDTGTVIALMPEIEEKPGYCQSYEHIGQHGAAQYGGVIKQTRPARQNEEIPLMMELAQRGYLIEVRSRFTPNRKAPME